MTCDVEEVGVPLKLDSDCAGDLWEDGSGDEASEILEGLGDGWEEDGSGDGWTYTYGDKCSEGFDE